MRNSIKAAALALIAPATLMTALPAEAAAPVHSTSTSIVANQDLNTWNRSHHRHYNRYYSNRVYRGRGGRYYCRRSDGTLGTVVGGVGGALVGHAVAGGPAGTILGAAGGALLGRSIDRNSSRHRCR